ncbi:MBL fold metallo-hydrolase [Mesorhizobium sp. WSM4976]|uniref:MBL fold metallo-hydrolase n=1 Tax=Mesorhizobium sp. WSM4976 TaxID=3038549 RepID=UPI0032424140
MPGWRWLHTPGQAPGHISLWREADHTLVAGDAFITTGQESAYEVAVQQLEMLARRVISRPTGKPPSARSATWPL